MGKIGAILRLTRIEHSVMLVIAVIAAEIISGGGIPSATIFLLSLITPIFVSMGAFAINDYFDIKVDRENKKMRPLVTGEIAPSEALYITFGSMAIGVAASAFINVYCFAIAIFFAAMSLLYSYRLKEILLLGNAYIALSMVIPFVFGSYVMSAIPSLSVVIISLIVFASGLAREIHGTIRDYRGDKKMRNVKTLPISIGIKGAAWISLLLYLFAIILSVYLFAYVAPFILNPIYALLIGITDLMLLYVGIGYILRPVQKFYDKTRNISLFAMGLALIAFLLCVLL
ncbi:MAG: UbiA family prenyltransferase [Candidatus Micrarchaeota archaeon]|nr:UbiA family prenyltransferase [Candidatus Micrarchaeota archaeon]